MELIINYDHVIFRYRGNHSMGISNNGSSYPVIILSDGTLLRLKMISYDAFELLLLEHSLSTLGVVDILREVSKDEIVLN